MNTLPHNRLRSTNPIADHPFAVELNVTRAHQEHSGSHPALREAHCLRAMFPDALSPIDPESDRFAGRFIGTPGVDKVNHRWHAHTHNIPAIGFLPLTPGAAHSAGYFCHSDVLDKKIADLQPDPPTRAALADAVAYWKGRTTFDLCRAAEPPAMRKALPFDWLAGKEVAHPAYPLIRMAGPMYDNGKLVTLGIPGLRAAVETSARSTRGEPEFFAGLRLVLDLLADTCRHYAAQARELAAQPGNWQTADDLRTLAHILEALPERAPTSFREATQLVLLFGVLSGAYSWGRLDDALGELLSSDLDSGLLDEEEATQLLQSLFTIINDNGAPFDNRVIIGGTGRRNPAQADRFALLAIEASRRNRLPLPQLSLRFHKEQNPTLYARALDALGQGATFPILYCDEVNVPAVENAMRVSRDQAEQYVPFGCGEYVLYRQSFGTPSGIFNHTKILECLMRNGREPLTGNTCGPQLGHLRDFPTFDDLLEAYFTSLNYWIELLADQQKLEYKVVAQDSRHLFWSLLYEDCLARGQAVFNGGLKHLGGTLESYGQTNCADSLYALKVALFDEQWLSADELIAAMDAAFQGHEDLQKRLRALPKYGNDHPGVDAIAVRLHEHTCLKTREQAARIGLDSYLIVNINNMVNTVLGEHTLASPDGRDAWEPLANANNPAPGRDTSGLTAFLNSLVKLRPDIHAGAVQNMKLSPDFFTQHRDKLEALLGVYFEKGPQAMITSVNAGDLEAAMREPEKYPNLLVRVGGFSARFVELPPSVQREVLERTLQEA